MSSNVSKTETGERLVSVRARSGVRWRRTVCNGESKGMGWPKGNGQTLVTRGTIHGIIPIGTAKLMVLRWIRGRLLNLFPVSLNSRCFFLYEPNRMSRGTHTKTSQSGSPKDFAHANKFSILAPDDKEFTGKCCTSMHTSRSQCSAHQVSYFAASGRDSKGVHHVSGSGWRRFSVIVDSGSTEHGVYVLHSWINEHPTEKSVRWPDESFPGRSARILRFRGTRGSSALCKTSLEES